MADDNREDDATEPSGGGPSFVVRPRRPRTGRDPLDTYYRLLASERRRCLLSYLLERSGEAVPLGDLVDVVADCERTGRGPGTHQERVAIDLHHVHLPKLAEAGVVERDRDAGVVRFVGPTALGALLDAVDGLGETPPGRRR